MSFDDHHSLANTGLALVAVLSEKLDLEELCDPTIDIAQFPGRRVALCVLNHQELLTRVVDRSTRMDDLAGAW